MTDISRRQSLKWTALAAASAFFPKIAVAADASPAKSPSTDPLAQNAWALGALSNFHAVYDQAASQQAFFPFLQNVYHLYPEQRFQQLIIAATAANATDQAIYADVQRQLKRITPFMADLRYGLPALHRQKQEMLTETMQLLKPNVNINGYLEIGTTGRYLSALRTKLKIRGESILLHSQQPTHELSDVAERGQWSVLGRYVDMHNYAPISSADIADGSLDLITNFIGFHHAPTEQLDGFVRSLHRVLRPGGRMIVRDHEVNSAEMNRRVALAHDVFNMGLHADWTLNQQEIRHFTSLQQLRSYLAERGFQAVSGELYQSGDPTHNALMLFIKA